MFDALVIGAGPAGIIIAAALSDQGLRVQGLTATPLRATWPNTYGIWRDELEALGLEDLLGYAWENCVSYFSQGEVDHQRAYGLLDKTRLQNHFLTLCEQGQVDWREGMAQSIKHLADHSCVVTQAGEELVARVVIDATGHKPVFVEREYTYPIAYQAAYGVVGKFSKPPVEPGQSVLMDFRREHLTAADQAQNLPTFLYAMDFGEGVYFVEETSLAAAPAVSFEILQRRLNQRLAARGIEILEEHEIERCLFPMNLPLPSFDQAVVGFGGSASMVHPASGYSVGAQLRRATDLAQAIATALQNQQASPQQIAKAGWQGLWPKDRLRKYYLYRFGLEKLMRFDATQVNHHFESFFSLPQEQWAGFLADGMTPAELVFAMMRLFTIAPNDVRWGLMQFPGEEAPLFWKFLTV
ncbi:lycopene cyclase family protein [filamentous cyanobacterium LEGE 11480]|uniref:Lycopene cyclase family protein n=1 Tax=Romeriopsis navalis LEGE 11480 TaxID=2777977 RepID=A0A928VI74_9CYAN|nr:lycopene cyclase family protein [Romeriopsis navalis]MBE9028238.1 lycopene cyclase family protein [Romeriopsis navalis LEGE 11480]